MRIAAPPADETMAPARDEHLDAIRALMAAHSPPLHALVVPSEDAHQVRAVPRHATAPPPPAQIGGGIGSPVWVSAGLALGFCFLMIGSFFGLTIDGGCGLFVQSEYVSEQDKRREFISGFTGSAGPF